MIRFGADLRLSKWGDDHAKSHEALTTECDIRRQFSLVAPCRLPDFLRPRSVPQAVSGTTNEFPGETKMKKMKVEEVRMKLQLVKAFPFLLSAFFTIPVATFAGQTAPSTGSAQNNEIAIICGDQPGNQSISGVLAHLDPTQPHTIRVSGTCKENVLIQSFDRLTLIANPGAAITDASAGNKIVVNI